MPICLINISYNCHFIHILLKMPHMMAFRCIAVWLSTLPALIWNDVMIPRALLSPGRVRPLRLVKWRIATHGIKAAFAVPMLSWIYIWMPILWAHWSPLRIVIPIAIVFRDLGVLGSVFGHLACVLRHDRIRMQLCRVARAISEATIWHIWVVLIIIWLLVSITA